jgi:hypothetical protein
MKYSRSLHSAVPFGFAQGPAPVGMTERLRANLIYTVTGCALGFAASNCLSTYCKIPPLA